MRGKIKQKEASFVHGLHGLVTCLQGVTGRLGIIALHHSIVNTHRGWDGHL